MELQYVPSLLEAWDGTTFFQKIRIFMRLPVFVGAKKGVKFYLFWCGPCGKPELDQLRQESKINYLLCSCGIPHEIRWGLFGRYVT